MKELERTLNNIAHEFECDATIGNEFAYYYEENLVVVDPFDTDDRLLKFAKENGLETEMSAFTISFFHELGHNETIDFVEEYEGDKDSLTWEEYFNLEEEFEATMWAIDFCNNNKEIVEKIEKVLEKVLTR